MEDQNAVREVSTFMIKNTREAHMKHMHRVMKYLVETRKRGLFMNPKELWDCNLCFELNI